MKLFYYILLLSIILASCSDEDYTNAIPRNCIAVISTASDNLPLPEIKGLNKKKNTFLFETADGMFGLCSEIADEYAVEDYLHNLESTGKVSNFSENDDIIFCTYSQSWIAGYTPKTFILFGPIVESERKRTERRITSLLHQSEEQSLKSSQLWTHLQEISSANKAAIQTNALPEHLCTALSIGLPKGTAPEDIILETEIAYKDSTIFLQGHTCSYNLNVKKQIQRVTSAFHPLTIDWHKHQQAKAPINIFMSVDGEELIPYLKNNKALNSLLNNSDTYNTIKETTHEKTLIFNIRGKEGEGNSFSLDTHTIDGHDTSDDQLIIVLNTINLLNQERNQAIPIFDGIKQVVYSLKK